MAGHKDIWGPHIDHYSQDLNFNLDAAEPSGDMSVSKLSGPWKDMEVMPMSLLETTLTRFNLRRGSCYGYRPLAVLLLTLQNYQRVNTSRIFKYYCGFLCIRCIIHIVCIGVLLEMGTLYTFLESLDHRLDGKQVCKSIAHESILQTVSAIRSESEPTTCARFEAVFRARKILPSVGGISASDCALVLRLLWEDRASFLTLCERGLLPGCPTLLYTISRIIIAQPAYSADLQPTLLQDLCMRQYFFAFGRDKYVLRIIWISALERDPTGNPSSLGEVDLEDSHALAIAYTRLLVSREPADTSGQTFDLDTMGTLLTFVSGVLRRDPSTKGKNLVIVEKTMSFLWLVLAKKINQPHYTHMLGHSHTYVRTYVALVLASVCKTQGDLSGTPEERYKFAQMIVETDVLALAGRVLLLMNEEGDPFYKLDGERWNFFISVYPPLSLMFKKTIPVAPQPFTDSVITWAKVFDQLTLLVQLGVLLTDQDNPDFLRCLLQMMHVWTPLGEQFHANYLPGPQPCAYPRCFRPFTHEKTLGVRYMCGKCGKAAYCNLNCQRAHWRLETVDSHRLECTPSERRD